MPADLLIKREVRPLFAHGLKDYAKLGAQNGAADLTVCHPTISMSSSGHQLSLHRPYSPKVFRYFACTLAIWNERTPSQGLNMHVNPHHLEERAWYREQLSFDQGSVLSFRLE